MALRVVGRRAPYAVSKPVSWVAAGLLIDEKGICVDFVKKSLSVIITIRSFVDSVLLKSI